jgi:hypothetical protein
LLKNPYQIPGKAGRRQAGIFAVDRELKKCNTHSSVLVNQAQYDVGGK